MIVLSLLSAVFAVISTAGNAAEIAVSRGEQRAGHIVVVLLMILALLAVGLGWPPAPTRIIGLMLLVTTFSMYLRSAGSERICCMAQMSFGFVALLGLPLAAA